MNAMSGYADEPEGAPGGPPAAPSRTLLKGLDAAPEVALESAPKRFLKYGATSVDYIPTYEEMSAPFEVLSVRVYPVQGPLKPGEGSVNAQIRNTPAGCAEPMEMEEYHFDENYHTFYNFGYSYSADGTKLVGNLSNMEKLGGRSAFTKPLLKPAGEARKRKVPSGRAEDLDGWQGPWAPYQGDDVDTRTDIDKGTATEKQYANYEEYKKAKEDEAAALAGVTVSAPKTKRHKAPSNEIAASECKSEFLGSKPVDYQGRSWIAKPFGLKETDTPSCFLPKKCVVRCEGHEKAVQTIRLFPKYGHLVLSGSMDTTVRIWDINTDKRCQRIYRGHLAAVRNVAFDSTGARFVSASFDQTIKHWDTETGKCLLSLSFGAIPYTVVMSPQDDNSLLAGGSNKKLVQFDLRSGEVSQSYDYHLGTINHVCFYDEGRHFVSTGDDKKILEWDYSIPVPIKYLTEDELPCVSTLALHPNGHTLLGSTLSNKIIAFGTKNGLHLNSLKEFRGHNISGYSGQVGISADGKFVTSGDSSGTIWVWDYKAGKVVRKLSGSHKGPLLGSLWHPFLSQLVTCGWDGTVKVWE